MKRFSHAFVLYLLILTTPALAWWGGGHRYPYTGIGKITTG